MLTRQTGTQGKCDGFLSASHRLSLFEPIVVGDTGVGEYVRRFVAEPLTNPVPEPKRKVLSPPTRWATPEPDPVRKIELGA